LQTCCKLITNSFDLFTAYRLCLLERLRYPGFGVRVRVAWFWLAIFSSISVPLLVIKVHIFRIISLSIARKQKKYDRITDISKTRWHYSYPYTETGVS
jgi:hypothetical protein